MAQNRHLQECGTIRIVVRRARHWRGMSLSVYQAGYDAAAVRAILASFRMPEGL